jgi:enoyl-CoA hydratase
MQQVIIEKLGSITVISINRPEVRNAVDGETAGQLAEAFRKFEGDKDALIAILQGNGGNFCAGADLKAISGQGGSPNRLSAEGDGPMGPTRMLLSKPVIAAISGYAVAGGLELACWCDLRVMEESAVMGVFCRRWGVPLIDGGTIRLPRLIGMSRAMDLILTGRPVSAQEALQMGLANRVVPDGNALADAMELANQLIAFPQNCLRSDRFSAYQQWGMNLNDALSNEFQLGMQTIQSMETLQGAIRFASGKGRHGDFSHL